MDYNYRLQHLHGKNIRTRIKQLKHLPQNHGGSRHQRHLSSTPYRTQQPALLFKLESEYAWNFLLPETDDNPSVKI